MLKERQQKKVMLSSKFHLTSKTSINHSFSCCKRKTPTFPHLFPSSQTKTNHHHPLTCASGVPQQPQHLSVGRISTSSGMTWNSTTKTFGTFGSQKLVLWVHVSPFSKAGLFHVNQRGVFGFAIHLQKVVDFFTTHRSYSYKDDIRRSRQKIKPRNLASLTTSGFFS